MKKLTIFAIAMLAGLYSCKDQDITVAVYYFPNYHPSDTRLNELKGEGWSEWELVKAAQPRFEGHKQPRVPVWGYTDESDPVQMEQKIQAAADHGIDVFIFDWYWDDQGIYWEKGLEEGYLNAGNNDRLEFALMWAMWDYFDMFPYTLGDPVDVIYPGKVKPETFQQACDYIIENYFHHPSYWKIDGKPYLSIYDLTLLIESFGTIELARAALDELRDKVKEAGFPDIHLNAIPWKGHNSFHEDDQAYPGNLVDALGFNSVTSYVWIHHVELPDLETDFDFVKEEYFKYWEKAEEAFSVPVYPNASVGWDPSPRTNPEDPFGNFGYPFTNTIAGNTPEKFAAALKETRDRILDNQGPAIVTINSWNEWSEGSYLEPDTIYGYGYLEAIKKVFSPTLHQE